MGRTPQRRLLYGSTAGVCQNYCRLNVYQADFVFLGIGKKARIPIPVACHQQIVRFEVSHCHSLLF